jgi:non-heme chloroperoxidase
LGGSGRPLILLNGGGGTAHGFDDFAPEAYGHRPCIRHNSAWIWRFQRSASGYAADRLGDDVLAVMESLKTQKPVLVSERWV